MGVNKAWHDKLILAIMNLYWRLTLLATGVAVLRHH